MSVGTATGVIELFLHPPLGLMRLEHLAGGPFSGLVTVTRPRLNVQVDAYGIRYLVLTAPAGFGLTPGPGTNIYDRTIVQLATTHQLLDGALVTSETAAFRSSAGSLFFRESFPRTVVLEMTPGVTVDLWWLIRVL